MIPMGGVPSSPNPMNLLKWSLLTTGKLPDGCRAAAPDPPPHLRHEFEPSYDGADRCARIVDGWTWTAADPIRCRRPRSEHGCPHGSVRYTNDGPPRCIGGRTAEKCICARPPRLRAIAYNVQRLCDSVSVGVLLANISVGVTWEWNVPATLWAVWLSHWLRRWRVRRGLA